MIGVVLPIVLLANGLAAGVLLATQLGGWPLLNTLPIPQYVRTHAFFSTRYDPWMPICIALTFVGDIVLAIADDVAVTRVLCGFAALLAISTGTISVTKNVPVNKWVRTLDPEQLPTDVPIEDRRAGWGAWNRRRSLLGMFAFLVNCLALCSVLLSQAAR